MLKLWTILILALSLYGCGKNENKTDIQPAVNLSALRVTYSGNILASPYATIFEDTEKCLHNNFNYAYPKNAPRIVKIENTEFMCNGTLITLGGCADFTTNTIYINTVFPTGYPVNHEVVHIITQKGNSAHGSPPFLVCGS